MLKQPLKSNYTLLNGCATIRKPKNTGDRGPRRVLSMDECEGALLLRGGGCTIIGSYQFTCNTNNSKRGKPETRNTKFS